MLSESSEILEPPWLKPLLNATFHIHCRNHAHLRKTKCNMYCLDCMGIPRCSFCNDHKGHCVLLTYIINHAKIVFLKERSQCASTKFVFYPCETCCRSLLDNNGFCSIECKFRGINKDPAPTDSWKRISLKRSNGAGWRIESVDTSVKTKEQQPVSDEFVEDNKISGLSSDGFGLSARDEALNSATVIPHEAASIINYRKRSRKGIPHRSPVF